MHLIFSQSRLKQPALVVGDLQLVFVYPDDPDFCVAIKSQIQSLLWPATSGAPQWQGPLDFLLPNKGPIPPSDSDIKDFEGYEVSTNGILINKPGIEGLFFPIAPPGIILSAADGYLARGNFGIHRDTGKSGTLGCIGIRDRFDDFCSVMATLRAANIATLPLTVV